MMNDVPASDELRDLLGELVGHLGETAASVQQGASIVSAAVEGGTADLLVHRLTEFMVEAVVAMQQYSELQMQWMLAGY